MFGAPFLGFGSAGLVAAEEFNPGWDAFWFLSVPENVITESGGSFSGGYHGALANNSNGPASAFRFFATTGKTQMKLRFMNPSSGYGFYQPNTVLADNVALTGSDSPTSIIDPVGVYNWVEYTFNISSYASSNMKLTLQSPGFNQNIRVDKLEFLP